MILTSHRPGAQPDPRFRRSMVAATAVALGTGLLLAPSAQAADRWGPGFMIPDLDNTPEASHIGAYGKPGTAFPDAPGHGYCADPTLDGPEAGGTYGPVTTFTAWTSKATGKQLSPENLARAAYVLSTYGETTDDIQAAAVDATLYSYLEPGTTYALPTGARALQRLAYPNVPAAAKTRATAFMAEADKLAGPYKVNIHTPDEPVNPGEKTPITLDVTSAAGHKVPGVKLHLNASGGASGAGDVTTNASGTASASITAAKDGTVDLTAEAATLPATSLRAQLPANSTAQRLLVAGGTSRAKATAQVKTTVPDGTIEVIKTAADTHKPLTGVAFAIKDSSGETAATGTTDNRGVWTSSKLAPGTYTVHEVRAVDGYQLAPDQTVSVTARTSTPVNVTDIPIPQPNKPAPRPVTITELPKTGA
ncbi:collagen binding domain-containing protein [Streptomyces sp. NPDC101062]|uniref:MSCRAMM family protein n=1 Tax=unclassified Streptomyces TaxID=2593676 RepID=UPI00381A70D1